MQLNEIATKADIEAILKAINELKNDLSAKGTTNKKFLRTAEVRQLLNISDGTLQRLRISGELKASKVNGTWFYEIDDIKKMIDANKS